MFNAAIIQNVHLYFHHLSTSKLCWLVVSYYHIHFYRVNALLEDRGQSIQIDNYYWGNTVTILKNLNMWL